MIILRGSTGVLNAQGAVTSFKLVLPPGTVAGDYAIVCGQGQHITPDGSGWTLLGQNTFQGVCGYDVYAKVLSSGDISHGTADFTSSGGLVGETILLVTLGGQPVIIDPLNFGPTGEVTGYGTFAAPPPYLFPPLVSGPYPAGSLALFFAYVETDGQALPSVTLGAQIGLTADSRTPLPESAVVYALTLGSPSSPRPYLYIPTPAAGITVAVSVIVLDLGPHLDCAPMPDGILGEAYSAGLAVSGGTGPYTWAIVAGSLPFGLSLDTSTGIVSGIPTLVGVYDFTVQVTDANSYTVTCDIGVHSPTGGLNIGLAGWLVVDEPTLGITDQTSRLFYGQGFQHSFNLQAKQRGSATYTLRMAAGDSYTPVLGEPIWLFDRNKSGYTRMFAGLVQDFTWKQIGTGGWHFVEVTAVSFESIFDTVYAQPRQYVNQTCGFIVRDLFNAFESGSQVTPGDIQDGVTVPLFNANLGDKLSDLFSQLATTSLFTWNVNPATQQLFFGLPSSVAAPFTLTPERAQWDSLSVKLNAADYRNRQGVKLSYDAFEHSKEFFVGAGQTSFTLQRAVQQVTNAYATLSTCNVATGTFSGQPSPGDTITVGPAAGTWLPSHIYALGGTITVGGFVQKVTNVSSDDKSGGSLPAFSHVTGQTTVDNHVIWTCQGPQGLATGTQTYVYVAPFASPPISLDNTQFGEIAIGINLAATVQNTADAINKYTGGATGRGPGFNFSLPTWENGQINAITVTGTTFVAQQKSAGTGWVAQLSATGTAFSWSSPFTAGGTSPQGSLGPGEGATISLQVYVAGTSTAAPALSYTPGSNVVNLATPLNVGSNLNVEYTRVDGNVIEVEDTALVTALAAITHGTGKYQQMTDASNTGLIATSAAAGLQFAQQALAAYKTPPREFSVELLKPGLLPGQEFTFALGGALGTVFNGTYFIEEVSAELVPVYPWLDSPGAVDAGHYRYTLHLIDIAEIGSYMDFWEGLGGGGGGGGQGSALVATSGGATPAPSVNASYPLGVVVKTASYTALDTDSGMLIVVEDISPHTAVTITLPAPPVSNVWQIEIQNASSYPVTVARNGLLIDGIALNPVLAADEGIEIRTDGANYFTQRGSPPPSVTVELGGSSVIGTEPVLNFYAGNSGMVIGAADNPTHNRIDVTITGVVASTINGTLGVVIDGGGSVPATGSKGFIQSPYPGTITGWTILADQSGSCQITVKKSTYFSFPTNSSIVASAPPVLSSAQKGSGGGGSLTGWTTAIAALDILEFNLDSVTSCTRIILQLQVTKT